LKRKPAILELLTDVPLGDEIPDMLYEAVSEILSFAFMLKNDIKTEDD
jgi:type III secretion system FlhB-like substrate exporter